MKKKDQTIVAKDIIFLYFCTFFKTFYRLQKKKKNPQIQYTRIQFHQQSKNFSQINSMA